jgi:hypothetical protein
MVPPVCPRRAVCVCVDLIGNAICFHCDAPCEAGENRRTFFEENGLGAQHRRVIHGVQPLIDGVQAAIVDALCVVLFQLTDRGGICPVQCGGLIHLIAEILFVDVDGGEIRLIARIHRRNHEFGDAGAYGGEALAAAGKVKGGFSLMIC